MRIRRKAVQRSLRELRDQLQVPGNVKNLYAAKDVAHKKEAGHEMLVALCTKLATGFGMPSAPTLRGPPMKSTHVGRPMGKGFGRPPPVPGAKDIAAPETASVINPRRNMGDARAFGTAAPAKPIIHKVTM